MDDDDHSFSPLAQKKKLLHYLGLMDADTRLAFEKMILWISERRKDAEPLGEVRIKQMIEEIRLENIRRRLGGKVGEIRPFKKPEPTK